MTLPNKLTAKELAWWKCKCPEYNNHTIGAMEKCKECGMEEPHASGDELIEKLEDVFLVLTVLLRSDVLEIDEKDAIKKILKIAKDHIKLKESYDELAETYNNVCTEFAELKKGAMGLREGVEGVNNSLRLRGTTNSEIQNLYYKLEEALSDFDNLLSNDQ